MPLVNSIIRKWNLNRDREEFEQIGRIALFEAWSKFDPKQGVFAAYAKSYVYGRMKSEITGRKKWQDRHLPTEQAEIVNVTDSVPGIDERQIAFKDWLERSRLTKRERIWAREALLYGLKPKEISEKYGVQVSTVKYWRKQALIKLKKMVEEE